MSGVKYNILPHPFATYRSTRDWQLHHISSVALGQWLPLHPRVAGGSQDTSLLFITFYPCVSGAAIPLCLMIAPAIGRDGWEEEKEVTWKEKCFGEQLRAKCSCSYPRTRHQVVYLGLCGTQNKCLQKTNVTTLGFKEAMLSAI